MKVGIRLPLLPSVLAIAGLLLASCAPAAAPTPAAKPTTKEQATKPLATEQPSKPAAASPSPIAREPKRGGIMRVEWRVGSPTLDPHVGSGYNYEVILQYNKLVRVSKDLKILPDLAESWDVSPDGLVYTFHLRKGVKFQAKAPVNGRELTSDDVVYSLQRVGTKTPPFTQQWIVEPITKYETPDKYTVKLTLSKPIVPFLMLLTTVTCSIAPKEAVEAWGDLKRDGLGTGPFVLQSYDPATVFRLRRHPDYFLKGLPYLDGVDQLIMPDRAARVAAFRTGKLDSLRYGFTMSEVEDVKKTNPNTQVFIGQMHYMGVFLNNSTPPFNDIRMRKAIQLGLDRRRLNSILEGGAGKLGSMIPPVYTGFSIPDSELSTRPGWRQPKDADLAEAKRLLAEAGYSGTQLQLTARELHQRQLPLVVEELRKIGINAVANQVSTAEWAGIRDTSKYSMAIYSLMLYPDIDIEIYPSFYSTSARNTLKYKNAEVDRLLDKQRVTMNPEERIQVFKEVDKILLEEIPFAPVYAMPEPAMVQPYVKNYEPTTGLRFTDNYWPFEEIWLDK